MTEDVIVINDLLSSVFLVKSNDGYIAIDAGMNETVIRRGLEYNGIKPDDVKVVLLTHSDYDHQNAIHVFNNAKVYFPKDEVEMVKKGIRRLWYMPFFSNSIAVEKYELLTDNREINCGGREIKCIALPGHTIGSMGYLIDGKYLFSGDAFLIKNGKLSVPPKKMFVMNIDKMKNSLQKLSGFKNIEYVFSSNSGFTADFVFAIMDLKS